MKVGDLVPPQKWIHQVQGATYGVVIAVRKLEAAVLLGHIKVSECDIVFGGHKVTCFFSALPSATQ